MQTVLESGPLEMLEEHETTGSGDDPDLGEPDREPQMLNTQHSLDSTTRVITNVCTTGLASVKFEPCSVKLECAYI